MDKKIYEFISEKSGEKIVEWKKCSCGEEFPITDKDMKFYEKISPSFNGKKYIIPSPTLCPDCRQQRRMVWRNERSLYKRKCDLTGKSIISMYSPDKLFKVYDQKEWWSDKWNVMDYGRDFDFSKGFFEQFDTLNKETPKTSLLVFNSENSEFNNNIQNSKNCYLSFAGGFLEDVYYSYRIGWSNNIFDGYKIIKCSYIYDSSECTNCFNCSFVRNSQDSSNCTLIENCAGCSDCIMCLGLKNKKYYILNKQYTKEEYDKMKDGYTLSQMKELFSEFRNKNVFVNIDSLNSKNSFGNNFLNCNNVSFSYECQEVEDSKYTYLGHELKENYDTDFCNNAELSYETGAAAFFNRTLFCFTCNDEGTNNLIYCIDCFSCGYCFGCNGLRNKQYCILNKQYTKEEYEILVPRIIEHMKKIGEWGEFFPASISSFGYNETVANEYYPLSKKEVLSRGFKWSDYEVPFPKVDKTIPADKLPENIKDIPDDILNWAIECKISGKPFRIVKTELDFYRKHGFPIPRKHPDVRHMDRMKKRASRKLCLRNCDKCNTEMISIYNKDCKHKVYCEECYNKEVI